MGSATRDGGDVTAAQRTARRPVRIAGGDQALIASVVAVLVPIVVAVTRGIRRGWQPLGDNAYFLIRSRDVLTSNHPLLGTWTSASQATTTDFNNPGPLLFDLWAVPAKLFGASGLVVGVAIVNGLSVIGIAIMVRRRNGPLVSTAAVGLTGVLCWSLGSEMLYDPWQPHSLLLAFLFLLTCVWSAAAGDRVALPWVLGVGSVVIQTHLSYAVLIVSLTGWAVLGLALGEGAAYRRNVEDRSLQRRGLLTIAGVSLLVVVVCWAQPVYENVTSSGEGNLTRLSHNISTSADAVGLRVGTRVVADTIAVPPFWFRPSFQEDLKPTFGSLDQRFGLGSVSPSFLQAAVLLVGLSVALVGGAWWLIRRSDRAAAAGLATAFVGLAAGVVTAVKLPGGAYGLAAHKFRWLWPLGAFVTIAIVSAALRLLVGVGLPALRWATTRRASWALLGMTIVVALATLPTLATLSGAMSAASARHSVSSMRSRMGPLVGEGPILIDLTGTRFAEPYSGAAMAELQARDVPFVVRDEPLVRQFGEGRRQLRPARALTFRQGDQASDRVTGARRVVYVAGLDAKLQRERRRLRRQVVDLLGRDLTFDRSAMLEAGIEPGSVPAAGDVHAAARFIDDGSLGALVQVSALRASPAEERVVERLVELEDRWTEQTIGLYLTSTPQLVSS